MTRPESHSVHHQRDVHAYNYGDIPLFDILFGTFRNPQEFTGEVGFFDGSSRKIGPMLIGMEKPVQIAPMTATASELVTLAVLAAGGIAR